ncbi:hypothetical protein ASE85_10785 [Sphingobium sp. Leaf26]|nr:hypothetical protein ASE85_10785 [Sphingobium sp. Leaf26]
MASIFRRHAMISCAFVGLAAGPALAQLDGPPVTPNPALIASTKVDTKAIDGPWRDRSLSPERRADLILAQMTLDEKLIMLRGFSGGFIGGRSKDPLIGPMQRLTGNYVPGVPRLGIPALHASDAILGVSNGINGVAVRPGDEATAFPSAMAMTATFEPALVEAEGKAVAEEFRARGMNMVLGPGLNLARDARGGRNFEYLGGEDPLLAGILAAYSVKGVQSTGVMANLKHYVLHDQTADSGKVDAVLGDAALRESDLLAVEIAVKIGKPVSVMCAYHFTNGSRSCQHDYLNNKVLKGEWGWKGFILSDFGAVHDTLGAVLGGLDQESAWAFDRTMPHYAPQVLKAGLASGQIPQSRIDDMVRRILWAMLSTGVYDNPPEPGKIAAIDQPGHVALARKIATRAIVLLKNEGDLLPLAKSARSIAVIGGRADLGVLTGGGSSAVIPYGGILKPDGGGPFDNSPPANSDANGQPILPGGNFGGKGLYIPSSPLKAIAARAQSAKVRFDPGVDTKAAAELAKDAEIAVVFVNQVNAEGSDPETISLPGDQDRLVEAVAAANRHTIVVIQSGNPIAMPWVDKVPAILAAWYPGQQGGEAIADILFGDVNPSGRLPVTFPRSDAQQPRPHWPKAQVSYETPVPAPVPGAPKQLTEDQLAKRLVSDDGKGLAPAQTDKPTIAIDYNIEGSDVGYRWYARKKLDPLFAFGHGLGYTRFVYSNLRLSTASDGSVTARFVVRNVGKRSGADVPQIYVARRDGNGALRLAGWTKIDLDAGKSRAIELKLEPKILADFDESAHRFIIKEGSYDLRVSNSAAQPQLVDSFRTAQKQLDID